MMNYSVNFSQTIGLDDNGLTKLHHAEHFAKTVVNTLHYKTWFMAFPFTQLGDLEKLSREELYEMMMKPVTTTFERIVRHWWQKTKTEGYELPDGSIHDYADFYDRYSVPDLANNIGHEGCHSNGFSHDEHWSVERDSSLPYAVGNWINGAQNLYLALTTAEVGHTYIASPSSGKVFQFQSSKS